MANSQNGWPVDKSGANQDRAPIYGNVKVPNGVLEGDVATVLRWVARRYHETVEPLVAGTCWGWFVKPIEGGSSISNHASGTAIDLNADQHPIAVAASKNMTAKQIAACHAIVKAAGGVIRWGGDYTGRPDPMHWEIVGSKAATAALAKKIRTEEDDVALTTDDINKVAAAAAKAVWATEWTNPANGRKTTAAGFQCYNDVVNANSANAGADKVITSLTPLITAGKVDVDELVAKLVGPLTTSVIASLPADRDDVTPAELQDAIVGALKILVDRPAA